MKSKITLMVFCAIVLVSMNLVSFNVVRAASLPVIYVFDPINQANVSSAAPDVPFTIEVSVANVTEFYGFEFYLYWNSSVLEFVKVAEGPFLNSSGAYRSFFVVRQPGDTGWSTNELYVADTLVGVTRKGSATGSGVVATVTFKAKTEGIDLLDLRDTILLGYGEASPVIITHTIEDGYFNYPLTKIVVEPPEVSGQTVQDFSINVTIVNVENLYNWTLKLRWTPAILDATNTVEGAFLRSGGTTDFSNQTLQTSGIIEINNTLTGSATGVTGNGTLATVTFHVEGTGISNLHVYDVKLLRKDGTFIPSIIEDGYFSNVLRDVAVTSVTVSATSLNKGESLNVTVVVENQGVINETFTVTAYYDSTSFDSDPVTNLPPGNSTTLKLKWDTKNVAAGTYTIKATASGITGDVDTADNTLAASSSVTVIGGSTELPIIWIIGGVAAVVVVIAVLGFFLLKRSKH